MIEGEGESRLGDSQNTNRVSVTTPSTVRRYLVIDVETSGLPKFNLPADDPSQPRLASLAIILLDQALLIESEKQFFIKPDGWSMSQEATAVNGITDAHLYQDGIPVRDVLGPYTDAIDSGYILVGHNIRMDLKIMRGELRRAQIDDRFSKSYNICTMRAAAPVLGLRRKNGTLKWPKLEEAFEHFFGKVPPVTHSALHDARSTVEIFRRLVEIDAIPEPEVFYSKNRIDIQE